MEDAHAEPLLFSKAIEALPHGNFLLQQLNNFEKVKNLSFLIVVKKHTQVLFNIQKQSTFSFVILEKKSKRIILRFNSYNSNFHQQSFKCFIWMFDARGCLLQSFSSLAECPPLDKLNFIHFCPQPLWKILNLNEPQKDPTNYTETLEFLKTNGLENNVCFLYYFSNNKKAYPQYWNQPVGNCTFVKVFTNCHYLLGFEKLEIVPRTEQKPITECQSTLFNERQANKSSAITVKLCGLNLAYSLGCCTKNEFLNYHNQLSDCFAYMWFEYDEMDTIRFVTVYSNSQIFQREIKNSYSWNEIFNYLLKEKDALQRKKESILSFLFQNLCEKNLEINTLYKKSNHHLKQFCSRLFVMVYSSNDVSLHALKSPLALYYARKKKDKFRGLNLNINNRNDLISLTTTDLTILNLNLYTNDLQFMDDNLPQPSIKSCILLLKNHKKDYNSQLTLFQLCKKRGETFVLILEQAFKAIGHFFMDSFMFDIFSFSFLSFSSLAFNVLWFFYGDRAGIYHHALEKTKLAYDMTIRKFSKGGFSFSFESELKCFEPLHKDSNKIATTICELDINSSYGYAGSNIFAPKGFCTAYSNNENDTLLCCEPFARYKSFEFLSVFYTLWLLEQQHVEIHSVYSNYHQKGLFAVNSFILDLAVVTKEGKLLLYQFDGPYYHGCPNQCPSLLSYNNKCSREELETKTKKRDTAIQTWFEKINANKPQSVFYQVIYSCHTIGYSMKDLNAAFCNISLLHNLVKDYPSGKEIIINENFLLNENITFIIMLTGFIPSNEKLLFLYSNGKWERSSNCNLNPILLSKDYLNWLLINYNFQITKVYKIFIYPKCLVFNKIFQELTLMRMNDNNLVIFNKMIKNIINYSAGFFGLNNQKQRSIKSKIVSVVGKKTDLKNQGLEMIDNETEIFIKKKHFILKEAKMSTTPLPIFFMIIEFGKLRLAQIFSFFEYCFEPTKYVHLYSNVDNLIIALTKDCFEDTVYPTRQQYFAENKINFFQSQLPGHLKLEWIYFKKHEWKFICPRPLFYVIVTNEDTSFVSKLASIKNIGSTEAYNLAYNILHNTFATVVQKRRVNKLINRKEKEVVFRYNTK
jgi:hypothetical protein